jgi:hypothetical protein
MNLSAKAMILLGVVLLVCAEALAERVCSRCNARAESDRWVYCPFCGTRYEGASPPSDSTSRERENYERVTWEKIRLDYDKFNHKGVRLEVRFSGLQHHFAPVERLGFTDRDYVNFYFIGNWTNYVKRTNLRLVERLKRLTPYSTVILFAQIQIVKNPGGQDIIVVLVDDIDA